MSQKPPTEWFSTWFDSPYYHLLYRDRDAHEAEFFLQNLLKRFSIATDSSILDIACGKGRHSVYLHSKGFRVTGIDLSQSSIEYAKQYETEGLQFVVHDMRQPFQAGAFDYVLNLFTSFGYFDTDRENIDVLKAARTNLKPSGYFVLDFLNTGHTLKHLKRAELKQREHIDFIITREVRNGFLLKSIRFTDHDIDFFFQEKVKTLYKNDFEKYFKESSLEIVQTFGNYALEPFDPIESPRCIFILKPKNN
jgi:SAM-dependent methyltransferase